MFGILVYYEIMQNLTIVSYRVHNMLGILVYYEIMQNLTIVSYRVHNLLYKFNKFSQKDNVFHATCLPVLKMWVFLLTLKAYSNGIPNIKVINLVCF